MVDQLKSAQRDQPDVITPMQVKLEAPPTAKPRSLSFPGYGRFRRLNLKTKATAIAIVIGTLPVLAIGTIAYSFANQSISRQITTTEETLATTLSQRVASYMAERAADLQILSNLPILTNPGLRDIATQEDKRAIFERMVESGAYESMTLFDLSGNAVIQTDRSSIPTQAEQDYFRSALQANGLSISRPIRLEPTAPYVVYIMAPVQEAGSGKRTGILRAVLPIKNLATELQNYNQAGGVFSVLDASNQIFLSSQENKVGQAASSIYSPFSEIQARRSLTSQVVKEKVANEEQRTLLSYVPWTGRDRLPDLRWDVLLSVPTEVAFAPQRQLLWTFLLGTGAAVVLTGLLAAWLARRATRPLLAAIYAVRDLGNGKLETRLPVTNTDEIGVLSRDINLMAGQLQTLIIQQTNSAERSQLLNQIIVKIRRSLSADDIFTSSVDEIRAAFKADRVVIYRFAPDYQSGTVTAESVASGWTKAFGKIINDPMEASLVDRYRDGRVWSMDDLAQSTLTHCHCEILERLEVKANVVARLCRTRN
jgi:methyl-accepting chemotaxis protein PixJ